MQIIEWDSENQAHSPMAEDDPLRGIIVEFVRKLRNHSQYLNPSIISFTYEDTVPNLVMSYGIEGD